MTDKTQPTELRTEIEKLMPCIACDGSGAYQSSEDEVEQCQYCYEYRFPGIDKLLALFSKTLATKTKEAVDNLLDEMIAVQERHITEAVRVSGREEAKDTLGWLKGWRKAQLKPPTIRKEG